MSSTGIILLKYLAPVLARMAFAKALGGTISPEDVAESLSELGPFTDKIEAITGDYKAATRGNRLFEEAGEIAAENLTELFGREGDGIEKDRIEAIVKDAANLLESSGLRLLIEAKYESTKFIKAVGAIPLDHLHLDSHEAEFFRRVLQDSGRILFTIAEKLPHFERENAARLLQNDAQILQEVHKAVEILKQMEVVSKQNNPAEATANFERDYRRLLAADLDKLKLFGIPQIDNYHQPLTMAFVHLNAVKWQSLDKNERRYLVGSHESEIPDKVYHERDTTSQGEAVELISSAKRMVIVGRAGAGKTTLLKWIGVRAAKQDRATPEAWHGKIPFYVQVRDYADKPFPNHLQIPVQFGRSQNLEGDVPKGWVDSQLRSGRGIILLDGLDEVRTERRTAAFEWLSGLITRYEKATYVISTRPATLDDEATQQQLKALNFSKFQLQTLEPEQVKAFIVQWHEALADDACSLPQAEKSDLPQLAQKLHRTLVERKQLQDLASNPLLCAMLCALNHRYKRELPHNRLKLYQFCLETLLDGRDAERGVDMKDYELAQSRIPEAQPYLGRVAYWMMRHDQSVINREELRRQLQLPDDEVVATQLVNYLVERSALLQEQAADEFDFAHRSFQEYLAAKRMVHDGDTTLTSLGQRAQDQRWRDTIRLVAGIGNEKDKQNLLKTLSNLYKEEPSDWIIRFALECYDWMVAPSLTLQNAAKKHIEEHIRNMKLDLSEMDISKIPPIAHVSNLQELNLSGTSISDSSLSEIASLTTLNALNINFTMVSDSGLLALTSLKGLKELYLSNTSVSNAGLPLLATLTNLQKLVLSNTIITDSGLSEINQFTKLKELFLANTAVSDAGLPHLINFEALELLFLSRTSISDEGLAILSKCTELKELYLADTAITDAGIFEICQLNGLELLDLRNTTVSDTGLFTITQLASLKTLYLGGTKVSDASLPSLGTLTNLKVLDLSNTPVSDVVFSNLANFPNLTWLNLKKTNVSQATLNYLRLNTNINIEI